MAALKPEICGDVISERRIRKACHPNSEFMYFLTNVISTYSLCGTFFVVRCLAPAKFFC